jgi:type IV pilus assembly protein PilW
MLKQKGFSLIELMVASVIGIVLLAGVTNLLITTNRTVSLSDGVAQNQETGRFAMAYLSKHLREAGYNPDFIAFTPPLLITSGDIDCTASPINDACAVNNLSSRGDRISVVFTLVDGESARSCAGTDLVADAATGTRQFATVFGVNSNPLSTSEKDLQCGTFDIDNNTWIDSNISILSNVEAFDFLVGLAATSDSKSTSRYVTVDQVTDNNLIRSIRIAILTTSQDQGDKNKLQSQLSTRKYALLDSVYEFTDGQLRNIFSNTIELPNSIEAAGLN